MYKSLSIASLEKLSFCHSLMLMLLTLLMMSSCSMEKTPATKGTTIFFNNPDLMIHSDSTHLLNDKLFTGTIISSTKPGKNELIKEVKNGKLHGQHKVWTAEQVLRTDKSYINGLEHGSQKGYHTNGNLSYAYSAKNGKRVGEYQEYYPNGTLQIERFYEAGVQVSNKIVGIDGKVIANYVLKDGRYYGPLGSSNCISVLNENQK